jgi:CheY-like chemotaxis protein
MSIQQAPTYRRQFFVQSPKAHYHVDSKQQKLNVMLVVDNPIPRYVEAYALAESGCIVTLVTEYKEVTKLLSDYDYQALFMDWLPNDDSSSLVKQIRAVKPNLPIIAIANDADEKNQAEVAGITACFVRPFVKENCQPVLAQIRADLPQQTKGLPV